MNKEQLLEKTVDLMRELRESGYDSGLMGAVGELYAEVHLGMVKAKRGERGFDGYINHRKVTVKSKERMADESRVYAEIKDHVAHCADDLLLLQMDEQGKEMLYVIAPIAALEGKKVKGGTRYPLKELKAKSIRDNFPSSPTTIKSGVRRKRIRVSLDGQIYPSLAGALSSIFPSPKERDEVWREARPSLIRPGQQYVGQRPDGTPFKLIVC